MAFFNIQFGKSFFPFLINPAFYEQEIKDYDPRKKQLIIITKDLIQKYGSIYGDTKKTQWEITEYFLSKIIDGYSENHPVNNNIFVAQYENNELVFFGRPVLCQLKKELVVLFGAENDQVKFNKIPLVRTEKGYTLNKQPVQETFIEVPDRDSPDPESKIQTPQLQIKHKVGSDTFLYYINVRLISDISYLEFKEIWEEKSDDLQMIVSNLFAHRSSISTMFSEYFATDSFPRDGIVLKVIDGKLYNDTTKYKFPFIVLTIDTSDLPGFFVTCTAKDEDPFQAPINEVSTIMLSDRHLAGQRFIEADKRGIKPTKDKPFYLVIDGINKNGNPKQVPSHRLYDSSYVSDSVKKLAEQLKDPNYIKVGTSDSEYLALIGTITENPL